MTKYELKLSSSKPVRPPQSNLPFHDQRNGQTINIYVQIDSNALKDNRGAL